MQYAEWQKQDFNLNVPKLQNSSYYIGESIKISFQPPPPKKKLRKWNHTQKGGKLT